MTREFKDGHMKEEAWELCRNFLSGPWKEISLDEFRFFEVRGGLSNTLYRCALSENVVVDDHLIPTQVLLRIYGPIQEENPEVVVTETVTFMLLSEKKLGPKLYGVFPKGRLEEFIPSHSLSSDDIRNCSTIIAREMAKIHALDVPVRKVPDMWEKLLTKWLDDIGEILNKNEENCFMTCSEYKAEMEWLSAEIKKMDSPVVYCHNDLQGGNILYREDCAKSSKPNLMLIDFEFGSYNYRGFDIANHFCEWCFDYDTKEYPHFTMNIEKFPSEKDQVEYFTAYLDQLLKEGIRMKRPLKEEIQNMAKEINLFASICHILWSAWSIKMAYTSTSVEFSYKIPDRKNSKETRNHIASSVSSDQRYWKEAMEFIIADALKEHGKTRTRLYKVFKERHLAANI